MEPVVEGTNADRQEEPEVRLPTIFAALVLAVIPGCAETPRPTPRPAASVAVPPVPLPPAAPPPAQVGADWRDWPLTPGEWRYAGEGRRGAAIFGTGGVTALEVRCEGDAVAVARRGTAASAVVRTSSTARTLPLSASTGASVARLPASDPLFDAIGFSRGRFVVESVGLPPLVVPAHSEILRVIEDCRS